MNIKSTLEDIFKDFANVDAVKKKPPELVEFNDDPVALAWGSYQIYLKNKGQRWTDLKQVIATEEDRLMAQEIRRYYRDKIMLQTLSSNYTQSEFRKKLYGIVANERAVYDEDLGILHRLPYFYVEDTAVDRAIEQTTPTIGEGSLFGREDVVGEYTVIERVLVGRRRQSEGVQFWLKAADNPYLHMIAVQASNPMLPLFESVIKRSAKLKTTAFVKEHRGYHAGKQYYQHGSVELA